jgi:hypothetical protein
MSLLTDKQAIIQTRVFDKLETSVTLTAVSTTSTDAWGDATVTSSTTTVIQSVPYSHVTEKLFEKVGDVPSNEMMFIVPHGTVFGTGGGLKDFITFDSNTYDILAVEKYTFVGGNLAYQVRAARRL